MTNRRKFLLWLLIIPVLLGVPLMIWPVSASDPHNGMELLFLIFGLPVFILNYLEWYAPQTLDEMLGKKAGTLPAPVPANSPVLNQMKTYLATNPGLQSVALMASLLLVGVVLGAGALTLLDPARGQAAPAPTASPSKRSPEKSTPQPETILKTATAMATTTFRPSANPVSTQPGLVLLNPTLTQVISITTTPGSPLQLITSTPPVSGACASPPQAIFDAIQSNVTALNVGYDIKKGYLVKSADIANMWFFSAKIYGSDFQDGVSDPGVWAFLGPLDAPTNIYAINDVAVQYSDYDFGQKASTPVDMQTTGTQTVFDCAAAGN
jgi:hypothetical protein